MAIRVHAETKAILEALARLDRNVADDAQKTALMQSALVVEREAKQQLTKSGRHAAGTPTPSAPGSPPAIITGTLRASVKTFPPTRQGFGNYQIMVGPTTVYARVQELGSDRLPARPYMQPALNESLDKVRSAYIEAVRKYAHG